MLGGYYIYIYISLSLSIYLSIYLWPMACRLGQGVCGGFSLGHFKGFWIAGFLKFEKFRAVRKGLDATALLVLMLVLHTVSH